MTDENLTGRLHFSMYRNGEEVGLLNSFEVSQTVDNVDALNNYLNFFSSVLKAAGFSYDAVGVHYKNGTGEHWSDY